MQSLSILIYNQNRSAHAVLLARKMARLRVRDDRTVTVMVYDDGSSVEDRRALEALPGAIERQFQPSPRGLGFAVNQFVTLTGGDLLLVLDSTISFDEEALEQMLAAYEMLPDGFSVSPRIKGGSTSLPPVTIQGTEGPEEDGDGHLLHAAMRECFLTRRTAVAEVGPLNEKIPAEEALSQWLARARSTDKLSRLLSSVVISVATNGEDGAQSSDDRPQAAKAEGGPEPWEIDIYRPGDEQAICDCFERVFEKKKPLDVWNWQFRDNPAGTRIFVARTASGRVVAQFAGLPVRMLLDGEPHVFTQMVDNMVDPEYRQGLRRSGVFSQVVYRYVDHFGNPEGETVGFGLPNPQAFRIGRRLLGYSHIQDVHETSRILTGEDASRAEDPTPGFTLEISEKPPADVDSLWNRIRGDYSLVAVRDLEYLSWRYERSPLARFLFVTARRETADDPDSLTTVAVLRTSYLEDGGTTAIVDWLSPAGCEEIDRAVLRRCEKVAIEHGGGRVVTFFPLYARELETFRSLGYVTEKSNWLLVGRTYHPEIRLDWVGENWHYTLGDFDLV